VSLEAVQSALSHAIITHFKRRERYSALLLQSHELSTLRWINAMAPRVLKQVSPSPSIIDARSLLDRQGGLACDIALKRIMDSADERCVLLAGPLNVVDYWAVQTRLVFWRTLATYVGDPGILITDTVREVSTRPQFRVFRHLAGSDVQFLRSRLAANEERVG